jgi:hypothetical protein
MLCDREKDYYACNHNSDTPEARNITKTTTWKHWIPLTTLKMQETTHALIYAPLSYNTAPHHYYLDKVTLQQSTVMKEWNCTNKAHIYMKRAFQQTKIQMWVFRLLQQWSQVLSSSGILCCITGWLMSTDRAQYSRRKQKLKKYQITEWNWKDNNDSI